MVLLHRRPWRHGRALRAKTSGRRVVRRREGIDTLRYLLPGLAGDGCIGHITTAVQQVPGVGLIGFDLANHSVVVTGHRLDGVAVRAAISGVADRPPPLPADVELLLVLGLELLRSPPTPEVR